MKEFKPKASYLRPQFSILWAGVACTFLCVVFAAVAATGAAPLALLTGSLTVIATAGLLTLLIEVASRIIPYARRDTQSITEGERLALYDEYESRHRRPPAASHYDSASPFGPARNAGQKK